MKSFLVLPVFTLIFASCAQEPITPINQGWRNGQPYRPIGTPSLKPYVQEEDSMNKGLREMSARLSN